jgi:mRNA-degrading endonuclease toxin of MazEF toxin-antitoxin module
VVRGEIYFLDLDPRSGSEQSGRRPGIIVSHDSFNSVPAWQSVTVLPLMTVLFGRGEYGLPKECAALAHQITTVDRSKLIPPALGRVAGQKLGEIDEAIRNYLDL